MPEVRLDRWDLEGLQNDLRVVLSMKLPDGKLVADRELQKLHGVSPHLCGVLLDVVTAVQAGKHGPA